MAIATPDTLAKPTPSPPLGETAIDLDWLSRKIHYRRYQECIHCGLCTASCPTYIETCDENDGPRGPDLPDARGRRRPLEAVRGSASTSSSASTAAPASRPALPGSSTARSIEPFKIAIHKRRRPAGERPSLLAAADPPPPVPLFWPRQGRAAPARLLQRLGVLDLAEKVGLSRLLPPTLRRMQAMLPEARLGRAVDLPEVLPPNGPKRARVGLVPGLRGRRHVPRDQRRDRARAPAERLRGVDPARARSAAARFTITRGSSEPALDLARRNIAAFDSGRGRRDHRQRRGLRRDAQGLRPPPPARRARRRGAVRRQGQGHLRVLVALGPIPPRTALPLQGDVSRRLPSLPRPADPQPAAASCSG